MFTVTLNITTGEIETSDGQRCNVNCHRRYYCVETIDPGMQPSRWFITDGIENVQVSMQDILKFMP